MNMLFPVHEMHSLSVDIPANLIHPALKEMPQQRRLRYDNFRACIYLLSTMCQIMK